MEKKKPSEEQKRKIITFSILGFIIIAFFIYAITDLNSSDKKEEISELEVPESEENKIGSKSKGIGTDTINHSPVVDLNDIYNDDASKKEKSTQDENVKKLKASINQSIKKAEDDKIQNKRETRGTNSKTTIIYRDRIIVKNDSPVVQKKETSSKNVLEVKSEPKKKSNTSGFFKKKKNTTNELDIDVNIYASVHTNQVIMNNQRVKFRTTKEFYYNGEKYPINTIIYGLAQIKPNRLIIKINKVNQTDIKLEVYDSEDSEQGLYVLTPNLNASLQKELKKEGLEDEDLGRIPFSRSLKSIFDKKVKEEKVQLINNYKVLIKIAKDE